MEAFKSDFPSTSTSTSTFSITSISSNLHSSTSISTSAPPPPASLSPFSLDQFLCMILDYIDIADVTKDVIQKEELLENDLHLLIKNRQTITTKRKEEKEKEQLAATPTKSLIQMIVATKWKSLDVVEVESPSPSPPNSVSVSASASASTSLSTTSSSSTLPARTSSSSSSTEIIPVFIYRFLNQSLIPPPSSSSSSSSRPTQSCDLIQCFHSSNSIKQQWMELGFQTTKYIIENTDDRRAMRMVMKKLVNQHMIQIIQHTASSATSSSSSTLPPLSLTSSRPSLSSLHFFLHILSPHISFKDSSHTLFSLQPTQLSSIQSSLCSLLSQLKFHFPLDFLNRKQLQQQYLLPLLYSPTLSTDLSELITWSKSIAFVSNCLQILGLKGKIEVQDRIRELVEGVVKENERWTEKERKRKEERLRGGRERKEKKTKGKRRNTNKEKSEGKKASKKRSRQADEKEEEVDEADRSDLDSDRSISDDASATQAQVEEKESLRSGLGSSGKPIRSLSAIRAQMNSGNADTNAATAFTSSSMKQQPQEDEVGENDEVNVKGAVQFAGQTLAPKVVRDCKEAVKELDFFELMEKALASESAVKDEPLPPSRSRPNRRSPTRSSFSSSRTLDQKEESGNGQEKTKGKKEEAQLSETEEVTQEQQQNIPNEYDDEYVEDEIQDENQEEQEEEEGGQEEEEENQQQNEYDEEQDQAYENDWEDDQEEEVDQERYEMKTRKPKSHIQSQATIVSTINPTRSFSASFSSSSRSRFSNSSVRSTVTHCSSHSYADENGDDDVVDDDEVYVGQTSIAPSIAYLHSQGLLD